jgi:hypothetical protein
MIILLLLSLNAYASIVEIIDVTQSESPPFMAGEYINLMTGISQ